MVLARDAATASRQADYLAPYGRSCRSIERAQWLIVSSRAILDRGRPAFSGGGPDALPETRSSGRVCVRSSTPMC